MKNTREFRAHDLVWEGHPLLDVMVKTWEDKKSLTSASLALVQLPVGGTMGPHTHDREYEMDFIVRGRVILSLPDEKTSLEVGEGATIPPGTVHGLSNGGAEPVEFLTIHTPPWI